ncbi:MAG TPA: glucose-6-phosphate dehydrogenase assembly protein OpcA [Polyangia bacterium]|jgi:glucose-6-phosphate dehydrogenase assembly protein OpcA|nr:glucose-6-phosphate dehydrogenase assembly protein OpcA [Polyangia bacterium]
MADDTDRLQVFEQGGAIEVPVGRIEAELAALWRRAAEARPGQVPNAVTRACLWNLVVRVRGEREFTHAKHVIDDLAQRIPARTIVMRIEPDEPECLRAWVEANWRRREGGGAASGSDEVTLWAAGKAVDRVPSLVRSLLYSDAPTAMFWAAALPSSGPVVRELVHQTDRLIVDTRKLADERGLGELCAIGQREPALQLADLSWIGISPLRGMCAALFDPPRDPSVLFKLDRVRVVSNIQGTQARGLLALGWLMSRLGWSATKRIEDTKGVRRWQAKRNDGQAVTLELSTEPGGSHGVAGLELHAGSDVWSLRRDTSIHVSGPDMPPRSQPARSHSDAELLASALGSRGRDTMFRDALGCAVALVNS